MRVKNRASFPVKAIVHHLGRAGEETEIAPGQTVNVYGPWLAGGYIKFSGFIVCQEGPSNAKANEFNVLRGSEAVFNNGDVGISVRHYLDPYKPTNPTA